MRQHVFAVVVAGDQPEILLGNIGDRLFLAETLVDRVGLAQRVLGQKTGRRIIRFGERAARHLRSIVPTVQSDLHHDAAEHLRIATSRQM